MNEVLRKFILILMVSTTTMYAHTQAEIQTLYKNFEEELAKFCYSSNFGNGDQETLSAVLHKNHPEETLLKRLCFEKQLPAYEKAALVAMVKDEEDIIFENLCWHYFMGFRKFIIIDNGSADSTGKLIDSFKELVAPSAAVIKINDPEISYKQTSRTNACAALAEIIFPDISWIFPNDADEFITLNESLEEALSKVPDEINSLFTQRITYIPAQDYFTYGKEVKFYQSIHHAHKRNPYGEPDSSQFNGKTFIRAHRTLLLTRGNHIAASTPTSKPIYAAALDYGIHIREFPFRSPEHALKKIVIFGKAEEEKEKEYPLIQFPSYYAHTRYKRYLEVGDAVGMEEFTKFMGKGGASFDECMPIDLALKAVAASSSTQKAGPEKQTSLAH